MKAFETRYYFRLPVRCGSVEQAYMSKWLLNHVSFLLRLRLNLYVFHRPNPLPLQILSTNAITLNFAVS